jgi:hypothetical protein
LDAATPENCYNLLSHGIAKLAEFLDDDLTEIVMPIKARSSRTGRANYR